MPCEFRDSLKRLLDFTGGTWEVVRFGEIYYVFKFWQSPLTTKGTQ